MFLNIKIYRRNDFRSGLLTGECNMTRGMKIFGSFRKRTMNHIPSSPICRCAKFFFSSDMQLNLESEMIMVCSSQSFGKSLVLSVSVRPVVCIVITHYNPSHASRVSHARFLLSCSRVDVMHRSWLNLFVAKNHVPSLSLNDSQ